MGCGGGGAWWGVVGGGGGASLVGGRLLQHREIGLNFRLLKYPTIIKTLRLSNMSGLKFSGRDSNHYPVVFLSAALEKIAYFCSL